MRVCFALVSLLAIAAAPAPDNVAEPIRAAVIAEAKALGPEGLDFDRKSSATRHGGGTVTTSQRIDRWNGKTWSLVSIAGKPPTRDQRENHLRVAKALPVPGYHRLAPIVAAATTSSTDAEGRTVWQIPVMPAGSVISDSGDISQHLRGEVRLARRGDRIWIDQLRVTQREAFKLNMLIKVTGFSQYLTYQLSADGKPRLASEASQSSGSMFGFAGGEKGEVTFTYR